MKFKIGLHRGLRALQRSLRRLIWRYHSCSICMSREVLVFLIKFLITRSCLVEQVSIISVFISSALYVCSLSNVSVLPPCLFDIYEYLQAQLSVSCFNVTHMRHRNINHLRLRQVLQFAIMSYPLPNIKIV